MKTSDKLFVISAIYVPAMLILVFYPQIHDFYEYSVPLNKAKITTNFIPHPNQFQSVYDEKDSTCFATPSMNQYCYTKPKIPDEQNRDHLFSFIVGDNGINGQIHFHRVGLEGGIFTIKNMQLIDEDSALFTFADKDYRIGNKDITTYKIIEDFEFDAVVEKFDSFITHCGVFNGTAATVVQYLGTTTMDDVEYFLTWHTVIEPEDRFQCKYPQIIQHSLNHDFGEL